MSAGIIPQITAAIQFEVHADRDGGCLILLPAATVMSFLARGITSYTFNVDFSRNKGSLEEAISIADAARMHVSDVDGLTFEQARSRIRRACESGEISSLVQNATRRLDADSLAAWRLRERERNLNDQDF